MSNINREFEQFIEHAEKLLTADEKYLHSTEKELKNFCDQYLTYETEIEQYCKAKHIPLEKNTDYID